MKIIYLNTWGGRVTEPLKKFFESNQDVDVFCLQEVWSGTPASHIDPGENSRLFSEIGAVLDSYEGVFAPADDDQDYGLAVFFRKGMILLDDGNVMIHGHEYFPDIGVTSPPRNLQYLTFQVEDHQKLTIINFHGIWSDKGKGDNDNRLRQSDTVLSFLKTLTHSFVLGGDFNLSPETESIGKLEDFGLRNLVRESGVSTTRTSLCTKKDRFADYIFVSKGVNVLDFKVLPDEVSDHAPLCVKISV